MRRYFFQRKIAAYGVRTRGVFGWLIAGQVGLGLFGLFQAHAQEDREFQSYTTPQPPYRSPEPAKYNLKWGDLTGRFRASMDMEFNDNINLSQNNRKADFSIGPDFGVGFLYPISKQNVLQLDFSFGYRWYLNNPSVSTFTIAPQSYSHIDYYILLDDFKINLHDRFTMIVDPTAISQLSAGGTTSQLSNFRQFVNTAGVQVQWQPTRKWSYTAGFDSSMAISLTGGFSAFDRIDHAVSLGANWIAAPYLTLGIGGSYTFTTYLRSVQNDGVSYSIGPSMTLKLTEHLTMDASVGYSISEFSNSGTLSDNSSFYGITYQVGLRHVINRWMSQNVRYGRSINPGYGSNFSESTSLQYGLDSRITSAVSLSTVFSYSNDRASGIAGEVSDQYIVSVGTSYRWTRRWASGLSYAAAWRDSNLAGHSYLQNRVTVDLSCQF